MGNRDGKKGGDYTGPGIWPTPALIQRPEIQALRLSC
jgi:hypothetical protein